jgi:lysozyme
VNAAADIKRHEGYREIPYRDHLGNWTVGHGILIESMPMPHVHRTVGEMLDWLTDPNVHANWFEKRYHEAERGAKTFAGAAWEGLSEARRAVLINMAYQLGYPRLSGFKRFREALQRGHWIEAREQMLDSLWAKQVPARAKELSERFLTG